MSGTGNIRDADSGQYVSLSTLFERERVEHSKDHEQERVVAKETAQRLEREVEQTAQRLERVVEETAQRIENAVRTALVAVAETARVHADAHDKEHAAHAGIHLVEKQQVDKAESVVSARLDGMNAFRATLQDQANRGVTRDLFDARSEVVDRRLGDIEKRMAYYAGGAAVAGAAAAVLIRLIST